ncbi:MAG: membrane protein insertase YidC [Desulfobulbaceae bacterium]|nr:membrane protein insertase YidC [Desulfobulbaceae bacterium]
METKRAIIAIILSLLILVGYQYLIVPRLTPMVAPDAATAPVATEQAPAQTAMATTDTPQPAGIESPADALALQGEEESRPAREITVDTARYAAVLSEAGGGFKSFKLKEYRKELAADSEPVELITTDPAAELPLFFSWGVEPERARIALLAADRTALATSDGNDATLTMRGQLPSGLEITRTMTFNDQDYGIQLRIEVRNTSGQSLQGAPYLRLVNKPISANVSHVFYGPAAYVDGELHEIAPKDLAKGEQSLQGKISWAAYESTYFMCGIIPARPDAARLRMSADQNEKVSTVLSGANDVIAPQESRTYEYTIYFGPKKLDTLKEMGHDLAKIVDFGWFDAMGKPTLQLLNFLNKYFHNYGIAIILVTIIIKLIFWPISHKGMKSMKTMQKIQPKMAKLREKYKDDQAQLNQEMMKLYQTYKINPLGGCLPMLLQIPVFFALYKVLLQTIELRHAPFMLWITDLSAPDRLSLGFHIPYLGGLPVLTLLMGGSMFLQQKMTPTSGDPTQAKMMLFLPVIFTFMFINFASGLVLYWFLNNLLSMLQQHIINRQADAEA